MSDESTIREAARYRYLRDNCFKMVDADMNGPSYPSVSFSFDFWHKNPASHNAEGLDAALDNAISTPKVGDKISGGRLACRYAVVEEITPEYIGIRYEGEVRTVKVSHEDFKRIC